MKTIKYSRFLDGLNENPRRRTLFLALRVYVKMSEIHETGGV